jgi:GTPase SAR1 family protein
VARKKKSVTPAKSGRRVMNDYRELKKKIEQRVAILGETIQEMESRGGADQSAAACWREQLAQVGASLEDPLLRIAVVGTVKSGKSTLVNALVGEDLLKRGAGIITAFITRLISHSQAEGWVEFKPWSQIQDELTATLHLLPHTHEMMGEEHPFDLKNIEDRERLKTLLAKMQEEGQPQEDHPDPSHLLLRGYLDGYDRVHQFLGDDANRLVFDQDSLKQHQRYVGSEGQAVYLRDMELHYPVTWLGESIELADCQGIDSPNPLHFALLQQYLLKSHFILYVVSSRSGLREADFRLLNFIRTLKMFPQTFFVLNADLDDHPHLEDLELLAERVRRELSWVVREPRFFILSALYQLLAQLKGSASEREQRHLRLWKEDAPLAKASEAGFSAFRESLSQEVCDQRFRVFCGSGLSRLGMIADSVRNTAAAQSQLMDQSLESIRRAADGLEDKTARLWGAIATLKNAILGLRISLHQEIERAVDAYFDLGQSRIVRDTLEAVEQYPVQFEGKEDLIDYRWLFQQFHRVYREFRQSLARFLVEEVNLQVIEFAKKEEASLCERLRGGGEAFWGLFTAALEDYRRETGLFDSGRCSTLDPPAGGRPAGNMLVPPNFSAFVDQGANGRGVLLMKLGLAGFTRLLGDFRAHLGRAKDLLCGEKRQQGMIDEAVRLLKKEATREILQAFQQYRQRFKSDYLFRIADEETGRLLREFQVRAEMTQVNLGDLLQQGQTAGTERQALQETLTQACQITHAMLDELDELRNALR